MSKVDLKLDWCSHEAAKYAVEHWHYSETMPVGKMVKVGVWEDGAFKGVVIFGLGGRGACNGKKYGLSRNFEMAELERVALREHATPVSRIISIASKMLHRQSPGIRMLISFADPSQLHHGGIYQGAGWIYTGKSADDWQAVWPDGRKAHSRIARGHVQFGVMKTVDISGAKKVPVLGKHRYLMPLDDAMRKQIEPLRKPYPKRAGSAYVGTPANHAGGGGSIPTPALVAGEICYEPFAGSGPQFIAAEQLKRRCFGIEISPKYCDVILARWEKFTGKIAEKI